MLTLVLIFYILVGIGVAITLTDDEDGRFIRFIYFIFTFLLWPIELGRMIANVLSYCEWQLKKARSKY